MAPARKRSFDFLPLSVRLATLGGVATPLVLRGTPLPTKRSETFSTAADNQVNVETELFLGERPLIGNNIKLGELRLTGIPRASRGQPQVKVEFSVDVTCAITARASLQGTQLFAEETFELPNELTEEFIAKALEDAESSRAADEAELLRVEATNNAKDLIARAEQKLKEGPDAKLNGAVAALGLALASGDSDRIREKSDALFAAIPNLQFGTDFADIFGSMFKPAARKQGFVSTSAPTKPRPTGPTPASTVSRKSVHAGSQTPPDQGLASQAHEQVLGKIFGGTRFTLDTQLCFVLMPFDVKFQPLYDDHIKPTVRRAGLQCERADDIHGIAQITWDIWERINRSRFLIAELTGQNPNVFYELGLAHALSKDVILITQSMDFVPFDLKTIRCIAYDFTPRGTQKLEKDLAETIGTLMKSA